jgi:ferrous iron transport protein B
MPKVAIKWLLVGAPNSGKTSLFNQLTDAQGEVMNYPGSTAVAHTAKLKKKYKQNITVIDTPGIYELNDSIPEVLEVQNLLDKYSSAIIVFVLDCRFIDHRIQLLSSLLSKGLKCVVYCTHVQDSGTDLNSLHSIYKVSFIDSNHPLALKTLIYAVDNINLQSAAITSNTNLNRITINKKYDLDRLFLHPIFSVLFTVLAMILIFSGVFYIAQPVSAQLENIMDFTIYYFQKSDLAQRYKLLSSFVSGGILGIGTLLIFVPQIFLLFMIIFFIQQSGYLARAAVILDPLLQKFGLHGKSFVPLLSGFSCAIPAILLTRTITSKKERLLTILAIPFMICSARIPMYAMCVSFLFQKQSAVLAGLAFAACYLVNICLGVIAVGVINQFLPSDKTSYFMMELPPYKLPSLSMVVRSSLNRVWMFIKNAGPVILSISLIVWFATNFPGYENPNDSARLEQSYAGRFGQWVEPIFKPMGTDWRVGTAILTSFAAREVFVSSITLLLGQDLTDTTNIGSLQSLTTIQNDDGTPLFSYASIIALLVFFMFALQCSSTTAVTAKETGSWKIAIFQFIIMNGLAYILAVVTYQILSRI